MALDVRNFEATTSRIYYNGVPPGTNVDTIKNQEGAYLLSGYPGPMFPAVTQPADPNDQVATFNGNDTAMVMGNFSQVHAVGDRIMLAVYNGTVMQIPDFAISPPAAFTVPSTTGSPMAGPNLGLTERRLQQHRHPAPPRRRKRGRGRVPGLRHRAGPSRLTPGQRRHEPADLVDRCLHSGQERHHREHERHPDERRSRRGIYTVWLEGDSGNPYFQTRRYAVPVKVGGAVRDFKFVNSTTSGSTPSLGGTISLPVYVSTTSASTTKWGAGSAVALTIDGTASPTARSCRQRSAPASSPSAPGR